MIPFVREIDVDYGQVTRVSPLIRRVIADNPGPFTYTGTGTYLVGSGEVAIIDPGPDLPNHLAAILAALGPDRLTDILVTHHHLDHSPLARPLAAVTGATIRGLAAPARADDGRAGLEAGNDRFAPDVPVKTGDRFSGPGWTLEALHTPGHTSNHVCYALVEENALFSGDHVMGWSTTVVTPPDGDMGDYMASLRAVAARDFATLWPTHGPPVTDVAPFLAAYSEHRRERERQILRRLAAGDETIAAMVPTIYASVDPRLHAAAAHSMLAHMIELVKTGAVTSNGPTNMDATFHRA